MRSLLLIHGVRIALVAAILLAAAFIGRAHLAPVIENVVQDAFFAARHQPASGRLHVVEIDAGSLAEIERWPWPRSHHARLVDQLNAAGVRSIVFDVDFSAASAPDEDAVFAAALGRSRARVVLPTFSQRAEFGSQRMLDSLPIAPLRANAVLGSVAVLPDSDGLVRRMPLATLTVGLPRPSLAAQIAQRSGTAGKSFPIDYAVDPDTIPRHSFVAIEHGRFDPSALRGKDVLVGATAIELFDRYATPRNGVIPGVIVQALASETLYRGTPVTGGFLPPLVAAGILAFMLLGAPNRNALAVRFAASAALTLALGHQAYVWMRVSFEMAPALLVLVAALATQTIVLARRHLLLKRTTDADSGLPNTHAYLQRQVDVACTRTIAVMIADFDVLKSVIGADSVGSLINILANRLKTQGCGPVIYRSDDRVLAWDSALQHQDLESRLATLKGIMRLPVEVNGRQIDVTVVFGLASRGAIAEATHAASVAQAQGTSWHYHQDAEQDAITQQTSLMGELDIAIEQGTLDVFYQPKLHLADQRITGVEALVRWHHPERGFMRPDDFIPLAERNDRIADLTIYVMRRTIADLLEWCSDELVLKAAVNISARLITSPEFLARAEEVVRTTGVPRDRLVFEVTESATMSDPEIAAGALARFAEMGIGISMDDYGTGQSSLTYLRTLPLTELKIDRSFVQHAHTDRNDALLVTSTIQLAHSLGLEVVAEGVEDVGCLAFLQSAGCDYAQGYFIGKPMPKDELLTLVSHRTADAA